MYNQHDKVEEENIEKKKTFKRYLKMFKRLKIIMQNLRKDKIDLPI